MDCDSNDKRDMLCQCFVEVVTESESKSQGVSFIYINLHYCCHSRRWLMHLLIVIIVPLISQWANCKKSQHFVTYCFIKFYFCFSGTCCWFRCLFPCCFCHWIFHGSSLLNKLPSLLCLLWFSAGMKIWNEAYIYHKN